MTLREKIGQLIFAGFPGTEPGEEFIQLIKKYKIGNIILFSRNIGSKEQVRRLCIDLQKLIREETGLPALISADQEGGMVTRLSGDCTNVPGAMAVAATGKQENAYAAGWITARELRTLGINVNLAPVLDVNSNPANPVIGVRSYGDSPDVVAAFGIQMMKGLNQGGVMSVLKHFPGHGDTAVDSHLALPKVDKTWSELEKSDLVPFIRSIKQGAEAVMTSHILFPAIETENVPATMSPAIITGLLRERLGFNGLVMSDCLEMNAVKNYYGTARGALAAIKAGVDMVFISHSAALVKEAAELIEAAVNSGELSMERLEEAVERVGFYKNKYAQYDIEETDLTAAGCALHRAEAERISGESIALVRDNRRQLPLKTRDVLFAGCHASHITNVMSLINKTFNFPDYMAENYGGTSLIFSTQPEPEDMERVLSEAKGKEAVVFGTYNGHLFRGQIDIINRLCREHGNVIVVALRNPYDLSLIDGNAAAVAAWEYTPLSLMTLIRVLKGEIKPGGRICVRLQQDGRCLPPSKCRDNP